MFVGTSDGASCVMTNAVDNWGTYVATQPSGREEGTNEAGWDRTSMFAALTTRQRPGEEGLGANVNCPKRKRPGGKRIVPWNRGPRGRCAQSRRDVRDAQGNSGGARNDALSGGQASVSSKKGFMEA